MRRYQRLNITNLHTHAEALWNEITEVCQLQGSDYMYEPVEKTSIGPVARIIINKPELVPSIIVLAALKKDEEWEKIYVANVIPQKSGVDRLSIDQYNAILNAFKGDVIDKAIAEAPNVKLEYWSSEYTIQDCIPKTYNKFISWIKGFPLSYHQSDMENWYEFVSSLHNNGEELGLDDFENCLTQDYHWSCEDAEDFSSRLSDELELLKVYDSMH